MRILCPYGRPVGLFCEVMDMLALKAVISKSFFQQIRPPHLPPFPPCIPLLPRDGRISKVCLWFWTQFSIPVVLYIPPPVPDFVFMKRGHLKCPVQAQQLPLQPHHSFRSSTKGGEIFLPFFLLTEGSVHFCVLTHPWFPPYFESLSLEAGEEAEAFVCS